MRAVPTAIVDDAVGGLTTAAATQPRAGGTDDLSMLSFQKLDVYQRAVQFLVLALEIIADLPKGHAELASQLRASAQSTVANIAEGAGRRTRADAGRHYFIARGSAMESASHLDVMTAMGVVDTERYRKGIDLLEGVVAMLTKMCDL